MRLSKVRIEHKQRISLMAVLFALYYLAAPMEDLLTGAAGTVQKYIAILIILVGAVIRRFHVRLPKNRFTFCMAWLMLITVLSCLWAVDFSIAVNRLVAYLTVPGLCLFATSIDFNEHEYRWIISSALLGGLIAFAMLLKKGLVFTGTARMILSESNDPNNMAALLFLPFALSFDRLMKRTDIIQRLVYLVLVGVFAFAMLMTGSRGGLLSALMFMIVYLIQGKFREKIWKILLFSVAAAAAFLVIFPRLPAETVLRMFSLKSYMGTGAGRTEVWKIVITEILPDSWLIGNGAGCAPVRLIPYYGFAKGVHNTYLNMVGEYGILGLPIFLFMLFEIFIKQLKAKKTVEAALLIGIFTTIFFLDAYAKKFFWNIIMFVCISGRVKKTNSKN